MSRMGWFTMGIVVSTMVVLVGGFVVNSRDNERCAKENNVFACKKVVNWVPVVPKD